MTDDFDKLLGGLNEPEPERAPAAEKKAQPLASEPAASPKRTTVLPWIVVGVVALLAIGAGVTFAVMNLGDADATAPATSQEPSPAESPAEEPSETPEPAPSALPAACRDIFSPAYYEELAATGAVLSEGNTGPREQPFGAEVPAVVESTIAAAPHLECTWSFADNFNVGIQTVVAEVTDEQAMQVTEALVGAGFTGVNELGSVRYIKEVPGEEGFGPHGYSIIARDGLLVATQWVDWPAAGYTADIVNTVLGPA
ncbi:hypothetical protein FVA74_10950 [Salinibacterium sp. dk2585]|uniref:hypothetical protein n=1 Tax=unclassified Salinibacterium TaxID=2632331 RepID=UPI0011C253F7|nr:MULTISPECIES: hypothetical protein [unclassified Salinibacterium]QEE62029.1 hypothetical protein FVA74_10950 [Salinibacterium sp. dk2585]TXK54416.1 hypothetical protein FVP63_05010 [Salinibacterium sp. dk5596]